MISETHERPVLPLLLVRSGRERVESDTSSSHRLLNSLVGVLRAFNAGFSSLRALSSSSPRRLSFWLPHANLEDHEPSFRSNSNEVG